MSDEVGGKKCVYSQAGVTECGAKKFVCFVIKRFKYLRIQMDCTHDICEKQFDVFTLKFDGARTFDSVQLNAFSQGIKSLPNDHSNALGVCSFFVPIHNNNSFF